MKSSLRAGTIATLVLCAIAAPASARQGPRQTFELGFTTDRPAASTGFSEAIDYVNPDDPTAKPFAVQMIVVRLAPGTQLDTSVPERCDAADPALISQGAGACPPGSMVGDGEVDLDTGLPGPGRIVRNDVTLFNNTDQVIFLFEREGGGRVVSRAQATDASFTTTVPPIPGGPPDGFTAIDRVMLEVDAVSIGPAGQRRSYMTTPRSCPEGGSWTNTATFSYGDGVTETAQSASPCVSAGNDSTGPGADARRCSNRIRGSGRSESLEGSSGSDRIAAKRGDDRIEGRRGDDCLRGGSGRDRIHGGAGDDEIRGGRGEDRIKGGAGDDVIRVSRGARDRVDCGPGSDIAFVNPRKDRVRQNCETVNRRR